MYTCPRINRIWINLHHNRCRVNICSYSRTNSFLYTNNTHTEIRCAVSTLFQGSEFSATKKWRGGPSNDFCLYGVKLQLTANTFTSLWDKENIPISKSENVNTVFVPWHILLHKSRVPKPHINSAIITGFVNRYTSPGFQTQNVTGNNGITHIHSSGHNLPYIASGSKRPSVCLHKQNSGVTSLLNGISSCWCEQNTSIETTAVAIKPRNPVAN
jgi:hypothetical protein